MKCIGVKEEVLEEGKVTLITYAIPKGLSCHEVMERLEGIVCKHVEGLKGKGEEINSVEFKYSLNDTHVVVKIVSE